MTRNSSSTVVAALPAALPVARRAWRRALVLAAVLALAALLPVLVPNPFYLAVANLVLINAAVAVSLTLLIGTTGQLSLGHAAFFASGAYLSAHLTEARGWPVLLALPCAVLGTTLLAWAVGRLFLKLSGYYLAVATLGIGLLLGLAQAGTRLGVVDAGDFLPGAHAVAFAQGQALQFAGSAGLDHGGFDCAQRARHRHGQGQALSLHGDQLAWRQIQSGFLALRAGFSQGLLLRLPRGQRAPDTAAHQRDGKSDGHPENPAFHGVRQVVWQGRAPSHTGHAGYCRLAWPGIFRGPGRGCPARRRPWSVSTA